ncbi:hypothetical protein JW979_07675 [bacterium]|nr:hypothetical protein [candidate division CSSED10-310 bacterium]
MKKIHVIICCLVIAPGVITFADTSDRPQSFADASTQISSFFAVQMDGNVRLYWETNSETGIVGFHLERASESSANYLRITESMLPGLIVSPNGGHYQYIDTTAPHGKPLKYRIIAIEHTYERVSGEWSGIPETRSDLLHSMQWEPVSECYQQCMRTMQSSKGKQNSYIAQPSMSIVDWLANQIVNTANISIEEPGIVMIRADAIARTLRQDPRRVVERIQSGGVRITCMGKQIPWFTNSRQDCVYFYGYPVSTKYSEANVFQVQLSEGLQMRVVSCNLPDPSAERNDFNEIMHYEQDSFAQTALFTDPESDYWFWDYCIGGSDPRVISLETSGALADVEPWSSKEASIRIALHGATNTASNPDHHLRVSLNGYDIGECRWDGISPCYFETAFHQSYLNDGSNVLELSAILDYGVPYSIIYLDSVDLAFWKKTFTTDDMLAVNTRPMEPMIIDGFSTPEIFVLNVTDRDHPYRISNSLVEPSDAGYEVRFMENIKSSGLLERYWVSTASATPEAILDPISNDPDLRAIENQGDYIVITTKALVTPANSFADYKTSQDFQPFVVCLENIYDQFGYGQRNPESIRDFLKYASEHWSLPPHFILLLGNGTYDYRNLYGMNDNIVPTLMASTPYGLAASDNRYADIQGDDGLIDLAIGRLPVLTEADVTAYLNKCMNAQPVSPEILTLLMLADNPDSAGNFPESSDNVINAIEADVEVQTIYLSELPISIARNRLRSSLENGVDYVNYIGHGGLDRFADEGLLLTTDISGIEMQPHYPIVSAMTCLSGNYSIPGYTCIGEQFILDDTGARIVFTSTGYSLNEQAVILDTAYVDQIFNQQESILGNAVRNALQTYGSQRSERFILEIFNLLGDPGLRLSFP